jgi:hypothetical protein
MKKKDFKDLLTSIAQARKMHNERTCKQCGKKIKKMKNNPSQEYCNETCWKKSHGLK